MTEQSLHYFQPLFGVDASYKYIERLYSDPEVKLALHNVFVLLLKGNYSVVAQGFKPQQKHNPTNTNKH
ncbi:MAG: ISNCY family transposase, partial [Nitrososphaerota archaeon]|nr:ISNCY family transposase [Nitrososphaerota archaeon]